MMDIDRDAKRRGIYLPLLTDPEGDSCFSMYRIRWIKNAASLMATISSSETFAKRCAIFVSVHKTVNSQGYSELREAIKTRTKIVIHCFGKYNCRQYCFGLLGLISTVLMLR